jgi:hypothetical protein
MFLSEEFQSPVTLFCWISEELLNGINWRRRDDSVE